MLHKTNPILLVPIGIFCSAIQAAFDQICGQVLCHIHRDKRINSMQIH